VGIGTSPWWKSILWGLAMTIVCALVGFGIAHATHYGRALAAFSKLPVWLLVFIVFRAGVVEELFYRGYAIERIESLVLNRFWAVVIPLTIFGVGHWTGGWANILIALALGVILSVFYACRRDLVAKMIAHFLVDFIGNIH
jgi:membrane protease YdiL (CAAX protease family)